MSTEAALSELSGPTLVDTASDYMQLPAQQRYELISQKFPAWLLAEPIVFPRNHSTYGWACPVEGCLGLPGQTYTSIMCILHAQEFAAIKESTTLAEFVATARPTGSRSWGWGLERRPGCSICGDNREAIGNGLCSQHAKRRRRASREGDFSETDWCATQEPLPPFGTECSVRLCVRDADCGQFEGPSKRNLCRTHLSGWQLWRRRRGTPPSVAMFEEWLASPATRETVRTPDSRGELHLAGLPAGLQREIRYGLDRHAKTARRTQWRPWDIQAVVDQLAKSGAISLIDPFVDAMADDQDNRAQQRIWRDLPIAARSLLLTKETAKEAGWFDHVVSGGKAFPGSQIGERRRSVWDLTRISQRWLRDALWDYLYDQSLEPDGKRVSTGTVFYRRSGTVLLSYVLEQIRPDRGNDPALLHAVDALTIKELVNLWFKEQIPVPPLIDEARKADGVLVERSRHVLMRNAHIVLAHSKERGRASTVPEDFLLRFPDFPVPARNPLPRPLSFGDYQLLVDPDNLRALDELDSAEVGLSDIWLVQAFQGGRISEVLNLRLGCIGMVGVAQPYLWRDISKINVVDYGIPCHVPVYERLLRRQAITKAKLRNRYRKRLAALDGSGRERLEAEWERTMPLFPGAHLNPDLTLEVSYTSFSNAWRKWFAGLGLSGITTHQTRATLATSLLNSGAPAELVRQLLGHFSDEALAHYARYNDASMAKHLKQIWAAGPGTNKPGTILLRPGDLDADPAAVRDRIDLAVIPVEHGICRYGPVVGGESCPFSKNCTSGPQGPCEHFALTGADLAYWERKRDAAFHFAEGAPNEDARDYILSAWDPWQPVLAGLREALDELGLLEEAEKLDLRSPTHDYFHPVFTTGWTLDQLAPPAQGSETTTA
ncbi:MULTISPECIES: tyrosine-type recombinase/integrase [Mycolicibacterium]|uniref:Transposase n=1 Tax=Mycolicibacterium llatzerense TaxID=280871 RepID=A0A0D1LNU4_9MYCO|nr:MULTISPECIES: tyrosine-type recombinase/integrase [Mycolicibacterium]KIU17671.1 transposase [Mycolicibacterium llatzerense]MCX8565082.1 tyrosine-type recombinase/integrase [Mycolicibacterium mucogenicum]